MAKHVRCIDPTTGLESAVGGGLVELATALGTPKPGRELITSGVASSSTALTFDGCFSAKYDVYEIDYTNLKVANDGVGLLFRWRNAGVDVTGTTHYTLFRYFIPASGSVGDASSSSTSGHYCPHSALGNNTLEDVSLCITTRPNSPLGKELNFQGHYVLPDGTKVGLVGMSTLADVTAMTGFKVVATTGLLASGSVAVYGKVK